MQVYNNQRLARLTVELGGLAPRKIRGHEEGTSVDQEWAERCIEFNQSVMDYLRKTPSIKIVVLSSPFSQYLAVENYEHVVQLGQVFTSEPASVANARVSLQRTLEGLRALGKKVVLIAPPPSSDFDIGGCLERQISGGITFGGRKNCTIDHSEYLAKRDGVLKFLESMASDVSIIRFDPWLCDKDQCATFVDNTILYRDDGHLSYSGSEFLAERMNLAQIIRDQAR